MKSLAQNLAARFLVLAILFSTIWISADAQTNRAYRFRQGDFIASVGVGVVPGIIPLRAKTTAVPVTARVDYFLKRHISLGLAGGYHSTLSKPIINNQEVMRQNKVKSALVGTRLAGWLHGERWNAYGGVLAGARLDHVERINEESEIDFWSTALRVGGKPKNYNQDTYHEWKPHIAGFVGAAYYFHPKQAVFTEISSDVTLLTVGYRVKL